MANWKQQDFNSAQVESNVSLAPSNSVSLLLNMDADFEIGSAVSRLGTATIGTQLVAGVNVLGAVQHVDQADTTKNKLFASVDDSSTPTNADIYDVVAGTKSLQDDTKSLKVYFLNYNGDTLRLNGTDAVKAYNSASWITTGGVFDLANMPAGYKYPIEFLDRVYLWGNTTTPYRLYYSGVLTSSVISWTTGQGYVDIEPEDNGGEATGLGKVPGYILIFKRRSMHRWNYSSAFPESLVNIGAYSQESIIEGGGICAFYSDSNEDAKGFYVTNGDRPICISQDNNRPIKKWVDAIGATAVVAGWATNSYFCWSVGDLIIDGETFSNVVLKYNRILNQWSVRTYPQEFKCFVSYVVSGVHTIVGGADDGTIYRMDKTGTYVDASTTTTKAFQWKVRTQHNNFGENKEKSINERAVIRGKNLSSSRISFIVDEDIKNPIIMEESVLKRMWKLILSVFGINKSVKGTTICVEVAGLSGGARNYVREIELPNINVLDNYL